MGAGTIDTSPDFSSKLWWQTGVFYQIYPRSFKDSSGNGIGDLAGIIQKMDYLEETLGVDAIWISPFYPSPMADFGYDVSDFTDVDPLFGDLSVFDELLAQAHKCKLKVIVDLVLNHTSNRSPWFKESRSALDNSKRDWYVWVDPKPDGSPPNNWLSVFGGSAWEFDPTTKQYYLHSFLKEQPDLNWRNPLVKEAMFEVARFWLDRGVDGFRIDVAHFIMKDPLLRDNPPNLGLETSHHKTLGEYDSQVHLFDKGHPSVHEIYRQFRQLLDSYGADQPRVSIGEIHIFDLHEWVLYYGEQLDEMHMPFNFSLLGVEWNPQAIRQAVDDLESALPLGAWPNYVLGNHDEKRLASRIGVQQARLAAVLLLTLRGTPTLYYGDEIGMKDVPIPQECQQDPWGKRVKGLGRDPCRTSMQWSNAPVAGFSPPGTMSTWLPLSDDYPQVNVETQIADSTSMLNLYRSLLAYRKTCLALQVGGYRPIDPVPQDCFAYLREIEGGVRVLVALNFCGGESHLNLADYGDGRLIISTSMDRSETANLSNLKLRGQEGVVVELSQN